MKEKAAYSTADLMKAFDLGRNTLRLYESVGLLSGMRRTASGYREYTKKNVQDLVFVLEAKRAGFTLNEIKMLLDAIRAKQKITCGSVSSGVTEKIAEIELELQSLQAKKSFLQGFLRSCELKGRDSSCDILSMGFRESACCN
jgi:MerR family transcriptional regulator, copper efflux regulator